MSKKYLSFLFVFNLILLSSCDSFIITSNNSIFSPNNETSILKLDRTNSPENIENSSFLHKFGDVEISYDKAFYHSSSNHISLNKTGFITNKTPFGKLLSFTIEYKVIEHIDNKKQNEYGFGYLKYRTSQTFIDNPNDYGVEITTIGDPYTVDLSKKEVNFISFWTPRAVEIKSLVFKYSNEIYQEPYIDNFSIQVFSTNDIHGQIKSTESFPGLSSLTNKMKSLASQNDQYNIFIDQGDLYQGTAEAGLSYGYNMDDFLIQNGYDAFTLGNHEFDWGYDRIYMHDEYLPIDILANNVVYNYDSTTPSWTKPYKLISRNGVKIGIIGAIGNCENSISASRISDTDFLVGNSLTQQIIKDSQSLKKQGADFIILSLHDGAENAKENSISYLDYYDINLLSGSYVDLVLEAHTHQKYSFYDSKGVYHIQNSGNGSSLSVTTIKCDYNKNTDKYSLSVESVSQYNSSQISASGTNQVMEEIDNWYKNNYYGLIQSEIIGKNVPYISSNQLRQIAADLYFKYGKLKIDKDDSTYPVLGGGFFSVRPPYQIDNSLVTYGDIYSIFPFDNDLVLCSISGYDLKTKFLETSKLNDTYYISTSINSNQIDNNSTYYIITDTYTSDYSYNNLNVIKNFTDDDGLYCRDLLAQYFRDNYL